MATEPNAETAADAEAKKRKDADADVFGLRRDGYAALDGRRTRSSRHARPGTRAPGPARATTPRQRCAR